MRRICEVLTYDREIGLACMNSGSPKNSMFLSNRGNTWLISGAFQALDMAGPLWFGIPPAVQARILATDNIADSGELVACKHVIFVQTNESEFYKKNCPVSTSGVLVEIWRDYYFSAFLAATRHAVLNGAKKLVLNNPAVGNGWPMGMWGVFCEAAATAATACHCDQLIVSDCGDMPPESLQESADFAPGQAGEVEQHQFEDDFGLTHIRFVPRPT